MKYDNVNQMLSFSLSKETYNTATKVASNILDSEEYDRKYKWLNYDESLPPLSYAIEWSTILYASLKQANFGYDNAHEIIERCVETNTLESLSFWGNIMALLSGEFHYCKYETKIEDIVYVGKTSYNRIVELQDVIEKETGEQCSKEEAEEFKESAIEILITTLLLVPKDVLALLEEIALKENVDLGYMKDDYE